MTEPRELTTDEVRENFLNQVVTVINYWATVGSEEDIRGRLSGLAHSILVILDGGSGLPGFIVAPSPHPASKSFFQKEGENWYPENHQSTVAGDIAGGLHEGLYWKSSGEARIHPQQVVASFAGDPLQSTMAGILQAVDQDAREHAGKMFYEILTRLDRLEALWLQPAKVTVDPLPPAV